MTSASNEKRISAIEALRQQTINSVSEPQQTNSNSNNENPLFADMNAAAMLLETFTQATTTTTATTAAATSSSSEQSSPSSLPVDSPLDDRKQTIGVAQKRMGSVAGATSMGMLRQQAAREGGYSLRPRDSKYLYSDDGSNQARWAIGSLIEKLDEKIKERSNDYGEWMETENNENDGESPVLEKRKRGRPRKSAIAEDGEFQTTSTSSSASLGTDELVNKDNPAEKLATKVTGGSLT